MELQSGAVRIASYRKKLPRKAKNIYLPTEVWVDVFCYPWITRPEMGKIVPKIGNRWFGDQLQFYLHEWGKHTLGHLRFRPQEISKYHNGQYQPLEYPQTAMPENIKFCNSFQIDHFDNRVFNFFRRIQSVLTADTALDIRSGFQGQVRNGRFVLRHLLPFIDGVHKLQTDDWMLPSVKQFPHMEFYQIKVLDVHFTRFVQSTVEPIMEWLTTGNEQKLFQLSAARDSIAKRILEDIRKKFMEAKEPSTFAVIFSINCDFAAFQSENAIGEQLRGTWRNRWEFGVFRHQANNAEAGDKLRQWWLDGNLDKTVTPWKQCIHLRNPTIGNGRIFAMPDLDEDEADDEKEDDEDKPSTSKKSICK